MNTTAQGATPSDSTLLQSTDSALDKASSRAHDAVDSIAGATGDAALKVKPAIDRVASMAHSAVDKAAEAATPAADWLAKQSDTLSVSQEKLVADTSAYVAANPLKSIGIAVAAGFLLSRILRS